MFGGALYGLVPLGMCISSGIFLWMKEVVRGGRSVEWQSEKDRGEMVSAHCSGSDLPLLWSLCTNISLLGDCESHPGIGRMDEYLPRRYVGFD
jgi:hypothetical protein